MRTAQAHRTVTAVVMPSDAQASPCMPPKHEFKVVPFSVGTSEPAVVSDEASPHRAAEVLNAGVAKALLSEDVPPDDLPFATGPLGCWGPSRPTS